MTVKLPDPRRYGGGKPNALAAMAEAPDAEAALRSAVHAAARGARDAEITHAYAAVRSRAAYARLWGAVADAVEGRGGEADVVARVFAMPWLLVCGARAAATVPCVLTDVAELARVLEEAGAVGASRNVGYANALCAAETLEYTAPSALMTWSGAGGLREAPPAPIVLAPGTEAVHVRFLLGAAVSPSHAPSVVETASNIGAWGMKATRVMARQLAVAGVDILPLPRPPAGVLRAAYAGRCAGLDLAFNLFLSNTLRRFRQRVGDPEIVLSTHEGGELRVTLHTPLDEGMTEGYRRPLHPLDDLDEIAAGIVAFARECRLPAVTVVPSTLPDRTAAGALCFPTRGEEALRH